MLACCRYDLERAVAWSEGSLALSRASGDVAGMGASLYNLGWAAGQRAEYAAAGPLFQACLALAREAGDPALLGSALISFGAMLLYQADHEGGDHGAAG